MSRVPVGALVLGLLAASALAAQEDERGCKDHPLFTRFQNTYLAGCESSQFDLRKYPVGQMKQGSETLESVEVEGPVTRLSYGLKEGTTPPRRTRWPGTSRSRWAATPTKPASRTATCASRRSGRRP